MRIYSFFPILPDFILFLALEFFFSVLGKTFISYSSENNMFNESMIIIFMKGYFCNIPGIEFKIINTSSRLLA